MIILFLSLMHVQPWCYYLSRYQEDEEKVHAFKGFCLVCQANPAAVLGVFAQLCLAVASWHSPPPDLSMMFGRLLHGFKGSLAQQNQWEAHFQQCPPEVQARLSHLYSL